MEQSQVARRLPKVEHRRVALELNDLAACLCARQHQEQHHQVHLRGRRAGSVVGVVVVRSAGAGGASRCHKPSSSLEW